MFDRSKFSAPKLDVNKKVSEEVSRTMKVSDSNRGDYHKIDEGMNVFRLFPPHNENEPTFQPKVVYWLECRLQKTDKEGKPIEGQYEWLRRPIFDSRIHGNTEKDIVDEYIKFTKNAIFSSYANIEDAKKALAPLNGWKDKNGKWNPGITPSTSFVAYATKGDITVANLGRLELWQRDKEELEKLNIDDNSGEVLSTDIWSGPDDGIQFVLNRQKNDKGKWENIISKKTFTPEKGKDVKVAWEEFLQSQIIPDDVLEHWSKMEPLSSQFKNAYKRSDFERAVEALQKFDKDNGYNTFENDEFIVILKEIDSYYPDDEQQDTGKEKVRDFKNEDKGVVSGEQVSSTSPVTEYSEMSRDELKKVIKDNNLPLRVFKSTPTEELAKRVEEAMLALEESKGVEDEEEEELEEESVAVEETPAKSNDEEDLPWEHKSAESQAESPVDRAAALRERLARINSSK